MGSVGSMHGAACRCRNKMLELSLPLSFAFAFARYVNNGNMCGLPSILQGQHDSYKIKLLSTLETTFCFCHVLVMKNSRAMCHSDIWCNT